MKAEKKHTNRSITFCLKYSVDKSFKILSFFISFWNAGSINIVVEEQKIEFHYIYDINMYALYSNNIVVQGTGRY